MVAFLAALPALISAMGAATDLFSMGKKVVADITGKEPTAQTPAELGETLEQLPPAQVDQFVHRMEAELTAYSQTSKRLQQDQGRLNTETLSALTPIDRGYVARLRMTTRPWAVRWMVIAVVLPPLALVLINMAIALVNMGMSVGVEDRVLLIPLASTPLFNDLYTTMVGWASGIIMTYMGMREIGKARDHNDQRASENSSAGASLDRLLATVKKIAKGL